MTQEELDVALEELEVRLERLRALYEQYFLGFEKIEPTVARKDVDRRIYVLRREKIRNTGKRFKLQTIIQRYNTFQQYWQRICREIENGTYKRHLLRAEKQLAPQAQLTIAAKRRFGRMAAAAKESAAAEAAAARAPSSPAPASGFPPEEARTTELARRAEAAPDSDDLATRRPPPPSTQPPAAQLAARRAPPPKPDKPLAASSRPPGARGQYDSLELDMGFLGSWIPGAPQRPGSSPQAAPPPVEPPADETTRSPTGRRPAQPRAGAAPAKPRSSPRAAPHKPRSSPKAAPPPKPKAAAGGLSDERVRDLHQKLSTLKQQNREAGQVSLESLSKKLRAAEAELRAKHKDRKIDFEVVLRDGKAIVKPTVR